MNQATRAGEKPFTKPKKNKKELGLPLNTVLLSAFKDFMLMVSCFSRNKRMQDVALDKNAVHGGSEGGENGQIRTGRSRNESKEGEKQLPFASQKLKSNQRPWCFDVF